MCFGFCFSNQFAKKDTVYLSIKDINNNGHTFELSDSSIWDIEHIGIGWRLAGWIFEKNEISNWNIGDKIEIQYPGSGNLLDFVLLINNITKYEKAAIKLKQKPAMCGPACLWVLDFNEAENIIILNDGSKWLRSKGNMYGALKDFHFLPLAKWEPGDVVTLIGVEGWFNGDSFLLWNHETNEMPYVDKITE